MENVRAEVHCYSGDFGSSHFSDIKMKSVSRCQFVDAFKNESGDLAMRFDGISSRLTIPWRNVVHASRTIMIFGVQFDQV